MQSDPLSPLRSPDWQTAPSRLELADDEIHLWRIFLDRPLPVIELGWLDPLERERSGRLRDPSVRQRFEAAHVAKRGVLGGYLRRSPAELRFTTLAKGKPQLADPIRPSTGLEFNLSHSAELALLAVSRDRALGVDLERLKPIDRALQIAERVFSETQLAQLKASPPEQRPDGFFRAWTDFEARQKVGGNGLFGPVAGTGELESDGFVPAPGFVAALSWPSGAPATTLRYFSFGDLEGDLESGR